MPETNTPETKSSGTPATQASRAPKRPAKVVERVGKGARAARQAIGQRSEDIAEAAGETFDNNPLGALAGAIAVGAIAAALIPATRRELETIGPVGERMREALEDAFDAAREAGADELTAAGLTFAAASNGLNGIVNSLVKAAGTSAGAAASAVRKPRGGRTAAGAQAGRQPQREPASADA